MSEKPEKKLYTQEFCVHVGTYDGNILGFKGTLQKLESKYAQTGSVKTMKASSRFLFVAGFDEIIRIFDAKKFKEIGNLDGHLGSILTMESHKNILISSGDDGNIMTWKFKEWSLIHKIKAHTSSIYDICIHPSGKILISISKDNRLFVWNLMNGQKAYQKRFAMSLNKVIMFQEDKYICVLSTYNSHIIDSRSNQELKMLTSDIRVSDIIAYKQFILIGDDEGNINVWDPKLEQDKKEGEQEEEKTEAQKIYFKAHSNRVKKMTIQNIDGSDFLITVSSSGEIKIWDFLEGLVNNLNGVNWSAELTDKIKPVYQIFTNQRITAMDVTVYKEEEEELEKPQKIVEEVVEEESEEEEQEQDKNKPKSILKKTKKIKKKSKGQGKQVQQQQQPQQQQQQRQGQGQKNKNKNKKNKNKNKNK